MHSLGLQEGWPRNGSSGSKPALPMVTRDCGLTVETQWGSITRGAPAEGAAVEPFSSPEQEILDD